MAGGGEKLIEKSIAADREFGGFLSNPGNCWWCVHKGIPSDDHVDTFKSCFFRLYSIIVRVAYFRPFEHHLTTSFTLLNYLLTDV